MCAVEDTFLCMLQIFVLGTNITILFPQVTLKKSLS